MKYVHGLTLAAALIFGCSSGNKSMRTASNDNPTATPQSGSVEGTGSTAGTAANTQGTATASTGQTSISSVPADNNPPSASNPSSSSSGSATMPVDTSNSTASPSAQSGTSGSVSGTTDNLETVTGSVAKVDQNSITLDQSAGGLTLTVDSNTQVLRRGQPIAAGISAIHEGEQVRASFDPASNRADKIEVMGRGKMKHHNEPANPR